LNSYVPPRPRRVTNPFWRLLSSENTDGKRRTGRYNRPKVNFRSLVLLLGAIRLLGQVQAGAIDSIFADYNPKTSPGCAVGIVKSGQLFFEKGYGAANLEYGLPLSPQSVFQIASASKPFTALSILILVQDGKLRLEDPIRRYLPEMPDYANRVTIAQLIGHTSGLRDAMTLVVLSGRSFGETFGKNDIMKLITRQTGLNFPPGDQWMYSNTDYILAGVIVERVSRKTLRQFADERIFGPLGMKNTHYYEDPASEIVARRATGYSPTTSSFTIDEGETYVLGAAGVHTTIEDLVRWDSALSAPPPALAVAIAALQKPAILNNGSTAHAGTADWTLGSLLAEPWGRYKTIRQDGAWAGFRSDFLRIPEEGLSIICLCNRSDADPTAMSRRMARLFLPEMPTASAKNPPLNEPGKVAIGTAPKLLNGSYYSPDLETIYHIKPIARGLALKCGRLDEEVNSVPGGSGFTNTWLTIEPTSNGFVVNTDRVRGLRFRRVAHPCVDISSSAAAPN
jgi:CubicO group peptidase (beta-lactamase class C family)